MSECVCVVLCVCLCVSALFGFGTSQPYNVFILYLYTIFTSASMWRFFLSLVACMHASKTHHVVPIQTHRYAARHTSEHNSRVWCSA